MRVLLNPASGGPKSHPASGGPKSHPASGGPWARTEAFSYECKGCGRCCYDKRITLSPYEIARLARARRVGTGEVLERFTDEGGTALRFREGQGCVFLEAGACTVHEGRPLACRLYPLGRHVDGQGNERFIAVAPHPESEGVYGEDGTISAWIEAQGAQPYIDAAARYHAVFTRMIELLNAREGGVEALNEAMSGSGPIASDWLDVDAVVARECAARGEPVPEELEARIDVHLAALGRWVDAMKDAAPEPTG